MAQDTEQKNNKQDIQLEGGTYEILRSRMLKQGTELRKRLDDLNTERKNVFGSIENKLIGTERISTGHACVPSDMISIGDKFIFGYNVHLGLKTKMKIEDVFSVYSYKEHIFHQENLELINNKQFQEEFENLYNYYKKTQFSKFAVIGIHLFMVFRVGAGANDIKTFKWLINGDKLEYLDNRSDHEFVFPDQHDFEWKRPPREAHQYGKHPHISIEDICFVETTEGDLTIKVENNTDTGMGILAEPVDDPDQTLDDADVYYSIIGNIVVLKIRPYQEKDYRYFVYNSKIQHAARIDALENACVLLPDDQGIIFSNGYYLQTGEYKIFDNNVSNMMFEKQIPSPNGEDYLYIFYNKIDHVYILLSYNLIAQQVETPVICNGYTIFDNGEKVYFRAGRDAVKHHVVQIWQTPYVHADFEYHTETDSYIFKIGNKDIVRGMAECTEVLTLMQKEDTYADLYIDLVKKTTDITDSYYWLANEEAYNLAEPLIEIKSTASSAIEEFEKVTRIKKNTKEQIKSVTGRADELIKEIKRRTFDNIDRFVFYLAELRKINGEVISLKELRYTDLQLVEKFENEISEQSSRLSDECVKFLLQEEALQPYVDKVDEIKQSIEAVTKVIDANQIEEDIQKVSGELEMLIDIVSNLKIDDATETTRIIDNISGIYASFNQIRAALRNKRKELQSVEGKAEFAAQIKLISQGVINYLDLADVPEKCDEFMSKLMVQLEELEAKFVEFDEFVEEISIKREEIYNAFESKKINLVESRNKRANTLMQSAERILKAISNKIESFETVAEINGYFASDLMIEKVRDIVKELLKIEDTVKADDLQSRLKTTREDAIRQLKDKTELFVSGENIIKFGKHNFTVNTQNPGLTMVYRNKAMYYHLTGTALFEEVTDTEFNSTRDVWEQSLPSENREVYRSEYLAWKIMQQNEAEDLQKLDEKEISELISKFMSSRYNEGYVKGVHDLDAAIILKALMNLHISADLLIYSSDARACAYYFWHYHYDNKQKIEMLHQIQGAGRIIHAFPGTTEFNYLIDQLKQEIKNFIGHTHLFDEYLIEDAASYLFDEISRGDTFVMDIEAVDLYNKFNDYIRHNDLLTQYETSLKSIKNNYPARLRLAKNWLGAFIEKSEGEDSEKRTYINETAVTLLNNGIDRRNKIHISLKQNLSGLQGRHQNIENKTYLFDYNPYVKKLRYFENDVHPIFEQFTALKNKLTHDYEEEMRLNEFKPRIMSSFVRNKLINNVYLPLIGNNLAKQIGTAGESKRTDLMGMLLLISPPGYGKTTLMEYIANRLGVIFMKINGPAVGHEVTSVDPEQARNSAAREELKKLNLAFEMGDNVMIYLDDIQHCNPEFLQKFISLADGQRKIEGVYKGRPRTYDFRGKKVCIVMAGNPYTESGEKFKIPDMLANRADIYNLGDIIGGSDNDFLMSYMENSMTSNSVLAKVAQRSQKDIYTLIKLAETGSKEGLDFEANHSSEEITEYVSVLKKMLRVRDVVYRVNQEYIYSAGQADEYRTEPAFKLQGSYRDMNKLAEKVVPIMNDKELQVLLNSHYQNESQTLTTGAEANFLKYKEMFDLLTDEENERWETIKQQFQRNQRLKGFGGGNQMGQVLVQVEAMTEALKGIQGSLKK